MKKHFILLLLILNTFFVFSQTKTAAESFLNQGEALYSRGDYQEAILKFNKCVVILKKMRHNQLLGKTYNSIGKTLSQIGKSEEALQNYFLSMAISKQYKDTLSMAKTYKNIGALYEEQNDFLSAMQYYESSFELAKKSKDFLLMADCQNNIGVVYEQQAKYQQALKMYFNALAIYKSKGDEQKISMVLNNLAIVHKYLKNYPEAIKNYKAALILSEKLGDKFMVAANQNNLGNVYSLTNNFLKSLELCKMANENAKAIDVKEVIIESYDGMATAYEKLYQLSNAIKYRRLYEQEKESFINSERSGQLAEMQVKYEIQKKVDEIKILNQEGKIRLLKIRDQEFQIERNNYLLLALVVLLTGIFIVWYFWKSKQKLRIKLIEERIIQKTEEHERLRIAKDIHDDLGSGLTKINFLSEIIFQKTENLPEIRNSSEAVKETAKKMIENMRDLIWVLNPDNTTIANLLARMREYSTDYLEDYPIELQNCFPENLPQIAITKEAHRELFMVVKESFNNIAKHSRATKVSFNAKIENDCLKFSIKDNGLGFIVDFVKKGNGLRNMQSRLESIDGLCTIVSNPTNGTEINVTVPIQKIIKI